MFEGLRESIESLRLLVGALDAAALDGAQAKELVEQFAEMERLAAAGRTLAVGRVAETSAWADDGSFRGVENWMAAITGTTVGRARTTVETAARLGALPATEAALRSGALSDVQVDVISAAAVADPRAETSLLACASTAGVKGLKDECARVEAAASTDQAERHHRVYVNRYIRHRKVSDVEGVLEMRGPLELTSSVMAALQPYESEIFGQARADERREQPEAIAFDAMVQLADDAAASRFSESPSRAPATIVFRVDHSAYLRGSTVPGEVCEIVGVGPIPVAVTQRLAGDSIMKALVHDGTDVLVVSHLGRTIPARLRTAVEELFPECAIAGCHTNRHLEIEHNNPVSEQGPTALWNLTRVCRHHHAYKHAKNLRIEGVGTNRHFVPAHGPPPSGRDPDGDGSDGVPARARVDAARPRVLPTVSESIAKRSSGVAGPAVGSYTPRRQVRDVSPGRVDAPVRQAPLRRRTSVGDSSPALTEERQ